MALKAANLLMAQAYSVCFSRFFHIAADSVRLRDLLPSKSELVMTCRPACRMDFKTA